MEEAPLKKLKRLVGESKDIRHGNLKHSMAKKMSRIEKHKEFVKKYPNKHSPYVKYESDNDNPHKDIERKQNL